METIVDQKFPIVIQEYDVYMTVWCLGSIRGIYENKEFTSYEEAKKFWDNLNNNDKILYHIYSYPKKV